MRPAAAYVHGLDGPIVIVSAIVAKRLLTSCGLQRWHAAHRGENRELDAVLVALKVVASAPGSATGAGNGTALDVSVLSRAPLIWTVGSHEAADLLGIGQRAVRRACSERRLDAQRVGGRWLIANNDLERFRAARHTI
jgi:excisionase family DNA binding protein